MKFNFKNKLMIGFSSMVIISVAISGLSFIKMKFITNSLDDITEKWLPASEILGSMNTQISNTQTEILKVMAEHEVRQGYNPEKLTQVITTFEEEQAKYSALIDSSDEQLLFDSITDNWKRFKQELPEMSTLLSSGSKEELRTTISSTLAQYSQTKDALTQLMVMNQERAAAAKADAKTAAKEGVRQSIVYAVIGALLALFIGRRMSLSFSRSIIRIGRQVKTVASGDFAGDLLVMNTKDEFEELAADFNGMTVQLREMIQLVTENADQVAVTSEELTATAEHTNAVASQINQSLTSVATGAKHQQSSISESVSNINTMLDGIGQISKRMDEALQASTQASKKAQTGNQVVENIYSQMKDIAKHSRETTSIMDALQVKSEAIENIVETIKGIASQTGLLALNAAIEAAHAGELGTGFAVVADEVRKLSDQVANETKQISDIIETLRKDIHNAVTAVVNESRIVEAGLKTSELAGETLQKIVSAVSKAGMQTETAFLIVEHVKEGTQKVEHSLEQIQIISEKANLHTQEIGASLIRQTETLEEVSLSSGDLARMAETLNQMVHTFKV